MPKSEEEVVYMDSEIAATPINLIGYADRHGGKHLTENAARYASANASKCNRCGNRTPSKFYMLCDSCADIEALKRYTAMPVVKWDGETPLVVHDDDRFFFDPDEAREYVAEHPDTRLCLCKPVHYRQVEPDYWDDLPSEAEIPKELSDALDSLNRVIASLPPAAWEQDAKRIDVASEFPIDEELNLAMMPDHGQDDRGAFGQQVPTHDP